MFSPSGITNIITNSYKEKTRVPSPNDRLRLEREYDEYLRKIREEKEKEEHE